MGWCTAQCKMLLLKKKKKKKKEEEEEKPLLGVLLVMRLYYIACPCYPYIHSLLTL